MQVLKSECVVQSQGGGDPSTLAAAEFGDCGVLESSGVLGVVGPG